MMSFSMQFNNRVPFNELPRLRKLIVVVCLAVCLLVGWTVAAKEIRIYNSSPAEPVSMTSETNRVEVMHGSVRYVTASQKESLDFWRTQALSWVGLSFLAAFLTWTTSPAKSQRFK